MKEGGKSRRLKTIHWKIWRHDYKRTPGLTCCRSDLDPSACVLPPQQQAGEAKEDQAQRCGVVPRRFSPDAAEVEVNLVTAAAAHGSGAQLSNSWLCSPPLCRGASPPSPRRNWPNGSFSARLQAHRSEGGQHRSADCLQS